MWKLLPIFIIGLMMTFWSDRTSIYETGSCGERQYIRKEKFIYFLMAFALAVFVGLRTRGNDTSAYRHMYDLLEVGLSSIRSVDWAKLAAAPGFTFVNILLKTAGLSFQDYLMVYALFTIITYLWFIRKYSCHTLFSVFLFFTMGIYGFTMAAIKQTAAVALLVIATDRAMQKKYVSFVIFVLIAELFHPYAFIYLIVPFLTFRPWSGKTYWLLAFSVVAALGLQYFLDPILDITDALGGGYDETSFTGDGVNIFRVLVVWVPVILSFLARNLIRKENDRVSNIIMNLAMVNAMIMFIGLFGTANYFARLANYFLIFQALALPWVLNFFEPKSKRTLTICAIVGFLAYFYYGTAIANGAFDDNYSFITFYDFLKQLL